jgi:hypothetical protein
LAHHHHLISIPFSLGLVHMDWIPTGHCLLDRKPMRVCALIMAKISKLKIRVFSYTSIQSGGMNLREKKTHEMAT